MVILYEIDDISRFPNLGQFVSYSRLVKCARESAGKKSGYSGKKIGNAYLKWAFSEAAVLFLRGNEPAQKAVARLASKHGKGKSPIDTRSSPRSCRLRDAQQTSTIRRATIDENLITMGGDRDVIRLTDKCHHTTSFKCVANEINLWAMSLDDAHDATWFVCDFD